MNSADQIVFVLQVVLALGPMAVYFLALGLVNSQARPCLVRARSDFIVLTIAFVPLVVWPILTLVRYGHPWLATTVSVGVAALFIAMLPRRGSGWVLYNVSPRQCRRLLDQACRRLGWSIQTEAAQAGQTPDAIQTADPTTADTLHIGPVGLTITQDSLPGLRNVTLWVNATKPAQTPEIDRLIQSLSQEIQHESMLPSPAGASLVLIGATLLGVPMWYLFQHMDLIVRAVRHILSV